MRRARRGGGAPPPGVELPVEPLEPLVLVSVPVEAELELVVVGSDEDWLALAGAVAPPVSDAG